jgi:transposase InsO family protein
VRAGPCARGRHPRARLRYWMRYLRPQQHQDGHDFPGEVREHFPFAIQRIQTDNDSVRTTVTRHLCDLRIAHYHIPPGRPEVNGKVERSHKTDSEEFYRRKHFRHKKDLARKLKRWEIEYNEDRPALHSKESTCGTGCRTRSGVQNCKRSPLTNTAFLSLP